MSWLTEIASFGGAGLVNGFAGVSAKAACVLLGALAVTTLLRRASASTRHQVWAVALLSVLALPALTAALPTLELPLLPAALSTQAAPAPATSAGEPGAVPAAAPRAEPTPRAQAAVAPRAEFSAVPSAEFAPRAEPSAVPSAAFAPRAQPSAVPGTELAPRAEAVPGGAGDISGEGRSGMLAVASDYLGGVGGANLLLASWILGVGFFLTRLALSALAATWLVHRAAPVADEALRRQARIVRADLGITADVRVVHSDRITMPMAWGIVRPTVLLPRDATTWSAARQRVVLLHEMAHLKRRDCQTLLLARLVTALHWFNPLAWTATRRLQAERERACDDLVLDAGTGSADYAQHLLEIARAMKARSAPTWATVAMARPHELEGRLLAILDPARSRRRSTRAVSVVALGALAVLLLPLAALQPAAAAQPQTQAVEQRVKIQLERQLELNLQLQLERQLEIRTAVAVDVPLDFTFDMDMDGPLNEAILGGVSEALLERMRVGLPEAQEVDPRVLQAMVTALQDEDAEVRAAAANALGNLESVDAVSPLAAVLTDDDTDVRSQAAWALGMIESDAAVAALSTAMSDAEAEVRNEAAWALGMIESVDAVPALAAAVGDADEDVREQVAWALGMIESAEAVDALSGMLRNDSSADVREQAAWALGMIEDEAALDALLDAFTDEDTDVRKQALWAVGQISG